MIDVDAEELFPFSKARSEFPGGKRRSLATLHRYRLHGIRGIRLETVLIGGSRYTSAASINRFIAAQNASETPAPQFTPSQRQRMSEAARKELAAIGI